MKYHFKIHKEAKGFWAQCIEIPGCVAQGDSKKELFTNMQDAINTYIEEPEEVSYLAPFPLESQTLSESLVQVAVDPTIALGFIVRYSRIKKGITQKEAAKKLGLKNIFSYQRLERRCNATIEMLQKLLGLFPQLPVQKIFG